MSYSEETKRQFIELRVEGLSFGKISEQLRIPKSTLHRWADEHADDILRSRRTEWEDLEATGHWRAEDLLLDLNSDLDRLDEHLRRFPIQHLTVRDTLMIIREKSRERDRLRALLMGTGRPCRTATKTERSRENGTTQPRNTNDLQQSDSESSHFSPGPDAAPPPSAQPSNPVPLVSSVANPDSPSAPQLLCGENGSQEVHKTERFCENGTTQPRNTNDLQQSQPDSFDFRTSRAANSVESQNPSSSTAMNQQPSNEPVRSAESRSPSHPPTPLSVLVPIPPELDQRPWWEREPSPRR